MIVLAVVILVVTVAALGACLFLLGFRLGGGHAQAELAEVRLVAVAAQRELHDLTRKAFTAMAEQAEQSWRQLHIKGGEIE
jgi:hypothetical protein